jgi:hypothetical protein
VTRFTFGHSVRSIVRIAWKAWSYWNFNTTIEFQTLDVFKFITMGPYQLYLKQPK